MLNFFFGRRGTPRRLGVPGEVVVELLPLVCPAPGSDAPSEATTLFLERARVAGGTVPSDLAEVAAIVRRLEGIPLAIELAAARTRVLSPRELLERLDRGHGVLGAAKGSEGRHARQRDRVVGDLLSEDERRALARLSVFAGGFTVSSAEPVLGDDAVTLVASLRDKSLVFSSASGRLGLYVAQSMRGRRIVPRSKCATAMSWQTTAITTRLPRSHAASTL